MKALSYLVLLLSLVALLQSRSCRLKHKCPVRIPGTHQFYVCPKAYVGGGLCAFSKTTTSNPKPTQTYTANSCTACSDGTNYYIKGECPGPKVYCDAFSRPQNCSTTLKPVCGYLTDCIGEDCVRPYYNGCHACSDTYVDHFVAGSCPGQSNKNRHFCIPSKFKNVEVCTRLVVDPVCVSLRNCTGANCTATATNPCFACAMENAESYVQGKCSN